MAGDLFRQPPVPCVHLGDAAWHHPSDIGHGDNVPYLEPLVPHLLQRDGQLPGLLGDFLGGQGGGEAKGAAFHRTLSFLWGVPMARWGTLPGRGAGMPLYLYMTSERGVL